MGLRSAGTQSENAIMSTGMPTIHTARKARDLILSSETPIARIQRIRMTSTGAEGGVCDNHKWIHLDRVAVPGV